MRLWHQSLLSDLPRQQLLGQHRECCALRGLGWGKRHATVNYVFQYPMEYLVAYHLQVIHEMERRGFQVASPWKCSTYRGQRAPALLEVDEVLIQHLLTKPIIYPEHHEQYLKECLENLSYKGIDIPL